MNLTIYCQAFLLEALIDILLIIGNYILDVTILPL